MPPRHVQNALFRPRKDLLVAGIVSQAGQSNKVAKVNEL